MLTAEMLVRGMNPQHPLASTEHLPQSMQNDYVPTDSDLLIVKNRIIERINFKPAWYKYYGKSIDDGKEFIASHYL